jgi:hypothetical protein
MAALTKRTRNTFKESDALRLEDLAKTHGLTIKRTGMVYRFEDYNAFGLDEALGYAEGYDRAMATCRRKSTDA